MIALMVATALSFDFSQLLTMKITSQNYVDNAINGNMTNIDNNLTIIYGQIENGNNEINTAKENIKNCQNDIQEANTLINKINNSLASLEESAVTNATVQTIVENTVIHKLSGDETTINLINKVINSQVTNIGLASNWTVDKINNTIIELSKDVFKELADMDSSIDGLTNLVSNVNKTAISANDKIEILNGSLANINKTIFQWIIDNFAKEEHSHNEYLTIEKAKEFALTTTDEGTIVRSNKITQLDSKFDEFESNLSKYRQIDDLKYGEDDKLLTEAKLAEILETLIVE